MFLNQQTPPPAVTNTNLRCGAPALPTAQLFGSGSGATKPEPAKTDACPNGRGLRALSIKGLPERVLPPKRAVFRDLIPPSPSGEELDAGAAAAAKNSPSARVYDGTSFARCAVVGRAVSCKPPTLRPMLRSRSFTK